MADSTARGHVLFRFFLRRFFDNDLVATDADRRTLLVAAWASLAVPGLWISSLLILPYNNPFVSPGARLLMALDHKLQFLTASMIVGAAVAVLEWDALSFDARDAAILGPLPIRPVRLVRAKLGALMAFAALFGVAQNALPTLLYPLAMVATLPIGFLRVAGLSVAHAVSCVAAAVFGFFSILALREALVLLVADRLAGAAKLTVRTLLLLGLTVGLLQTPRLPGGYAQRALSDSSLETAIAPPFWFLGVYESLSGSLALDEQRIHARRLREAWRRADEDGARAQLASYGPSLRRLAARGVIGLLGVVCLGSVLFLINYSRPFSGNRRRVMPHPVASRYGRAAGDLVARLVTKPGTARAGFGLTLAALGRSPRHRLLAVGLTAVGCAVALVLVGGQRSPLPASGLPTTSMLAAQSLLLLAVLTGQRLAANSPADPLAGWMVRLSWLHSRAAWGEGVRRAVVVSGVVPVVVVVLAVQSLAWPANLASSHAVVGVLAGLVMVELLFGRSSRALFVERGRVGEGVWGPLWPVALPACAGSIWGLALLERAVLKDAAATGALAGGLLVVLGVQVSVRYRFRRPDECPLVAEAPEEDETQRIGLDPW